MLNMDFRHLRKHNSGLCGAVLVALVAVNASGCASLQDPGGLKTTMQTVGQKMTDVIDSAKVKGPSESSRHANNARLIASKYPLNQAPHTLMKKPVAEGKLTSSFGYRRNPTGWLRLPQLHKGIDYFAATGTPVYAAGDGTIVKRYTSRSYGNFILIEHENGFSTSYAHMQAFADGLSVGSHVRRGQMIGNVGSTGSSTAPHLHFELRYGNKFIDPLFEPTPPVLAAAN